MKYLKKLLDGYLSRIQDSSTPGLSMDSPMIEPNNDMDKRMVVVDRDPIDDDEEDGLLEECFFDDENNNVIPTEVERKRILIDFDGPIHKYSKGYKDGTIYDEPSYLAKYYIDLLKEHFEIYVFTTRVSPGQHGELQAEIEYEKVKKWLDRNKIHYDKITSDKYGAVAYIDDNGINYCGCWVKTMECLKNHINNNGFERK